MTDREQVVTNGCRGLCCVAFYFPREPEECRNGKVVDGDTIADMLIPLTNKEAKERLERFGSPMAEEESLEPGNEYEGRFFTCRHFNEEEMLCRIYPVRPQMCSDFPYGRKCEHGCSCKGTELVQEIS